MAWAPQQAGLQEILQTIHSSTDTHNAAVQRSITLVCRSLILLSFAVSLTHLFKKLNSFTRVPDYIAYLAYILSALTTEEDRIRTIAGYLLKNNARLILRSAPEVAEFVKAAVLQAFNENSTMIRNTAGQDIVAFLGILEPRNWPECLQHLLASLESNNVDQQEVVIFHLCH